MSSHKSAFSGSSHESGSHVEERKHKNSGAAPDKEMNDEKSGFQHKERNKEDWKQQREDRAEVVGRLLQLIICTVALLALIFLEVFNQEKMLEDFKEYPCDTYLILARFFCATFLHL